MSPYVLALFSFAVFLIAVLLPPQVYSHYVGEPDYIFLDFQAVLLFVICAGSFLLPIYLIDMLFPTQVIRDRDLQTTISKVAFLSIPLLVLTVFCLLAIIFLLRENPNLMLGFQTLGGEDIKERAEMRTPLGLSSYYLLGIFWWATWRADQMKLTKAQKRLVTAERYLALLALMLHATLKVARGELLPIVIGTAVIVVIRKAVRKELTAKYIVRASLLTAVLIIGIVVLFTYLRGESHPDRIAGHIMAYSLGSYNRLSAVIDGRMSYPLAGHGYYLFTFLSINNMLNAFIPFRDILSVHTWLDIRSSEFAACARAGLNGNSMWASAFGYIFAELGWAAPLYTCLQGFLCGLCWWAIKKGNVFGIVIYPLWVFCIMFWVGVNFFFDVLGTALFTGAVGLYAYEWLLTKREIEARVQVA